tara:strand:+ start:143 stop:400 length:258 start_codon:yes stop_codon:yes gene_type:complete
MHNQDYVCVCYKVSLGKLKRYIDREKPKVPSQLADCLGAGTGCGWCRPFLDKIHSQYASGNPVELKVNFEHYKQKREAYKIRNSE